METDHDRTVPTDRADIARALRELADGDHDYLGRLLRAAAREIDTTADGAHGETKRRRKPSRANALSELLDAEQDYLGKLRTEAAQAVPR
jgi:phytoene dehydrogenase-like protein